MTGDQEEHAAFVGLLIARMLREQGLDPRGADIVADALRRGRNSDGWQRPSTHYRGITAQPWHDAADFEWTAGLCEAFPKIRDEALALQRGERFAVDPLSVDLAEGAWNEIRFHTEGQPNPENLAACPHTAAAVSCIPGAASAGLVYFSATGPRTHLKPHCGPHNARLRCQLGLVMPEGCRLRVGPETRSWEAGTAVVFDDSFEHELWNDSNETRIVLIVDVWHPDLSADQILAIRFSELAVVGFAYELAATWARTGSISSSPDVRSAR
jgi:aspartyl/asparaginyl beta-hydroxylase (cupin superfamily)